MTDLLDAVTDLCHQAGAAILQVYRQDFAVDTKADDSPVTAADRAAHELLAAGLAPLLADVPVLSEEGGIPDWATRRQWQRYWLVDPLDGTKEFIKRNDEFTVNVALIDHGRPVLGVVHVPALGETYGGDHRGAWRMDPESQTRQPIHCRAVAQRRVDGKPLAVMASRSHGAERTKALLARLEPVATRSMGSSLKFCAVAAGEADLYPRLGPTSEWDTAAAQAVVEAAGGAVWGPDLKPLRYNQEESLLNPDFYVVGDPHWHQWRQLLPE